MRLQTAQGDSQIDRKDSPVSPRRTAEGFHSPIANDSHGASLTRIEAMLAEVLELLRDRRPFEQDDPVAAKVEMLRAACIERGIVVSGDGFIKESDAARLLNRAPVTLRNWRYCEKPLPIRMFAGRIE